jgi:hypothetical protein
MNRSRLIRIAALGGRIAALGLRIAALGTVLGFGLGGCKQGLGDRCQVNSDCASGLVCSAATGTCTNNTSGGIDAVIPDAKPIDAPKLDAHTFLDAHVFLDAPGG